MPKIQKKAAVEIVKQHVDLEAEAPPENAITRAVLRGYSDTQEVLFPSQGEYYDNLVIEQITIPVPDKSGLPPRVRFIKSCAESAKAKGENTVVLGTEDLEILFEWLGYPVNITGRRTMR